MYYLNHFGLKPHCLCLCVCMQASCGPLVGINFAVQAVTLNVSYYIHNLHGELQPANKVAKAENKRMLTQLKHRT